MMLFNYVAGQVKRLARTEKGQGMVEYGLIIALIAIVVIVALSPLGRAVRDLFNGLISPITNPAGFTPGG